MFTPRSLLFMTVLIDLIGFGIIIPIMPFLVPSLGGSTMDIAYIIAIYSVFSFLMGPFWGKMSDRFGRKPIILLCLAGGGLSYVMMGLATSIFWLYASRVFAGLMAGNFGVASAMMADITPPQERAKGMGMIGAAFGLGMVIGPTMGGILAGDSHNFLLPCLAAGCMSLFAIIAGLIFLPESLPAEKRAEHAAHRASNPKQSLLAMLKETGNGLLVCQYFIHNTCISSVSYLFPLWVGSLLGWGAKEVGYVFGVQGLAMALLQGKFIGTLAQRFGDLPFLIFGVSLMISGFVIAAMASTAVLMVLSFFMAITGATCCTPILNTLTSKRTPPPLRGRMLGTTSSMASLGRVTGVLVGGFNLTHFGFSVGWIAAAVIACFLWAWAVREKGLTAAHAVEY
jgi:DHA1 family tetracycline resistance protein-like MFS transporter